jgi:hypothetical protein
VTHDQEPTMSAKRANLTEMVAIRQAITLHRGGFKEATDAELMALWRGLSDGDRQAYLAAIPKPTQEKTHDRGQPPGDVSGGAQAAPEPAP